MRLFLIRHGESVTNVHWDKIVENRELNSRLTEKGHTQASNLAEWMKLKVPQIDQIYTSSLQRTRETTKHFEDQYGITAIVDHRIREGGYSHTTGAPIEDDLLPMQKIADFHENPFQPFAKDPDHVESFNDLRTRVGNFLAELKEIHRDENIIVIMHGWTLNALIDLIFNVGLYRSAYVYAVNTSLTYVEYRPDDRMGPWRVHFIAQTPHLDVSLYGLDPEDWEA
ncbi:MAG: histidine phosphatase family protein [Anaerolineales bacterium]|jgi:broad specificity phosphatase PhoE